MHQEPALHPMDVESAATDIPAEKTGLAYWMQRTVQECDRVAQDLAPDPVHNLRVALRRCRSIAEGFKTFDPDPSWNDMRKEAARLFRKFGELRDIQVMIGWVKNPEAPADDASRILLDHLTLREKDLRAAAAGALSSFDRRKWAAWTVRLSKRADRIAPESLTFRHLALEGWHKARFLHRQALRNRSHIGFHRLRIGLKKLRYIAENFLPGLHESWSPDLRELQDLLGEMHDLHVLLQTARALGALEDVETRDRWRSWISEEGRQRLERYHRKMVGRDSLWQVWRSGLPDGDLLESAVMERLQTWASFRDPDSDRSQHAAVLALQLYDGLARFDLLCAGTGARTRAILRAAALMHAVGSSARGKKGHKESYRVIIGLNTLIGWEASDIKMSALVVRYHRGALPKPEKKEMRGIPAEQRQVTMVLSGILRLAVAFTASRQPRVSRLLVRKSGQALLILARGYQEYGPLAQKLARARYLLELACGLPVIIRSSGRL
jgi:CHAD domain-containing protein